MDGTFNFYPHTCVIRRGTGKTDPETFEEVFSVVYEGECGLQRGNSGGNTSIREGHYLSSPLIIIPDSLVDVRTNDEVVVTVENSRIIRFLALEAEAVADPDVGGVTVWLNKGDDQNG